METIPQPKTPIERRGQLAAAAETLLIFALIALYGAWPIPDVNEQYYIGKAIHCWNPDWFPADAFLDAPDSHAFFFRTFGVFSLVLSPTALVWFGRLTIWLLTAIAWRRLSRTLIPRPGAAILTAAGLLFYLEYFHLAGEWLAGGVEGKGFAFPLVFLGLADFIRGKYNRAFILLGGASAFHVLVGGWSVAAALGALTADRFRGVGRFGKKILPGLIIGGTISLFGLIPALRLDAGTPNATLQEAHRIYVFERLAHHLVPSSLPWTFLTRFGLLTLVWTFFCLAGGNFFVQGEEREEVERAEKIDAWRRWNKFVAAAILIAAVGVLIDFGTLWGEKHGFPNARRLAAELLRFYWLRLSDWAVPAGVALGGTAGLCAAFDAFMKEDADRRKIMTFLTTGLAAGGILFFLAKKILWTVSVDSAKAATLNPSFPVMPKSVDAAAFLAATFGAGILALSATFGKRRKDRAFALSAIFLTVALGGPVWGILTELSLKSGTLIPRSAPPKESIADGWLDVCRWLKANTPPDAVILTPRGCDSLKWNAGRQDAGNWKEIPQDARSIVAWYRKMEDLYTPLAGRKEEENREAKNPQRWNQPLVGILINKGAQRIEKQAKKYGFRYIVAELPPYTLGSYPEAMKRYQEFVDSYEVYRNGQFTVFRLEDTPKK